MILDTGFWVIHHINLCRKCEKWMTVTSIYKSFWLQLDWFISSIFWITRKAEFMIILDYFLIWNVWRRRTKLFKKVLHFLRSLKNDAGSFSENDSSDFITEPVNSLLTKSSVKLNFSSLMIPYLSNDRTPFVRQQ